MVYPGSVLMTDMFFCMFSLPKEYLECFTNLNIAQICCMLQKSQKWYILDQHWWLVYFPPFCSCFFFLPKGHPSMFFLGIQNICDLYKSKYSSDTLYDWKFSEMVHPRSALMIGMFSCILCIFCLPNQHPHMFFSYQNASAKAAFHQNIPIMIILIFLL